MIVPHVLQSGAWLGKGFITMVTLVRAHTSVSANMTNQCEFNSESLATDVALVRTQAGVYSAVAL